MLNVKALLTKMLLDLARFNGTFSIEQIDISNSSSADIPMKSGTRGIMIFTTASTAQAAIYSVGVTSTGTVSQNARLAPSNPSAYTLTASTNNLKVANSAGAVLSIFYLHTN